MVVGMKVPLHELDHHSVLLILNVDLVEHMMNSPNKSSTLIQIHPNPKLLHECSLDTVAIELSTDSPSPISFIHLMWTKDFCRFPPIYDQVKLMRPTLKMVYWEILSHQHNTHYIYDQVKLMRHTLK